MDSNGNKYQAPLAASFTLGIMGSLIYFLASIMPGRMAVNAILLGRFITGMGAAGKSLIQSWIATAIPLEDQKIIITLSTMVGTTGQLVGPPLNILVQEINTSVAITPRFNIPIIPLNSIGLLLALNEVLLWLIVIFFLKDPPSQKEKSPESVSSEASTKDILKALTHFDISFPVIQQFVVLANFQMYMVSMAPVAESMLNWTPVEISKLTVVQTGVSFVGMSLMMYLSMRKTADFTLLCVGNGCIAIAGVFTYLWWRVDTATTLTYALPILLICLIYPLSGPANQSSFNKAVFNKQELSSSIGVLQSIYQQGGSIAGILTPFFVTSFVIRDPKDVSMSSPFEFTRWAWYVPISSSLLILGLLYEEFVLDGGKNELGLLQTRLEEATDNKVSPGETSKLVTQKRSSSRRSIVEINQVFTRKYEVDRRMSNEVIINGVGNVNPFMTAYDEELLKEQSVGKKELEHLIKLDEKLDGMEMNE